MKKRRPLAKLIGDLARPSGPASGARGTPGEPAEAVAVPARKPPARIESDARVVPAAPHRLIASPIVAALAKAARADGRRRRGPARPSRRGSRAS